MQNILSKLHYIKKRWFFPVMKIWLYLEQKKAINKSKFYTPVSISRRYTVNNFIPGCDTIDSIPWISPYFLPNILYDSPLQFSSYNPLHYRANAILPYNYRIHICTGVSHTPHTFNIKYFVPNKNLSTFANCNQAIAATIEYSYKLINNIIHYEKNIKYDNWQGKTPYYDNSLMYTKHIPNMGIRL